jgi:type II secretory ATPase GspE/PulE/Tfp pilus assembly ATPase PilB-like protein
MNPPELKIIFDININSLEYLIKYLISKEYDFFTLEPEENKVKVAFRKDNLEKESKYIKYPAYSSIILKAKSLTKLKIEDIVNPQEGTSEINLNKKIYKTISKTVP